VVRLKVTYLGHAGFVFESEKAKLLIDPWLTNNPVGAHLPERLPFDLIALTHGHFDHLGDSLELATENGVPILTLPELAAYCKGQGAETELINYGGTFIHHDLAIKCVLAFHSTSAGPERANAPGACGYVVKGRDATVYHAGDTCVFGDMRLIGDQFEIDAALLPIGGRTTMDPEEARLAIDLLHPRTVVPIHFGTWAFIEQDVSAFKSRVEETTTAKVVVLNPGDSRVFLGT
jgi:L-ascorbate metabolism protein UlaG (beta-lactamase superfamily)